MTSLFQKITQDLPIDTKQYGIVHHLYGHFYYIHDLSDMDEASDTITLTLPTRLQKEGIDVCVGDIVKYNISTKTIEEVIPRLSRIEKPKAANIDQAVIVVASTDPEPDLLHLDRLILQASISLPRPPIICITKTDLYADTSIFDLYRDLGYTVLILQNFYIDGILPLLPYLDGHTSIVAGRSGVGKSTLLNTLSPDLQLKTNEISTRTKTGTHTTRTIHVYTLSLDGYVFRILDTPGFNNLETKYNIADLQAYMPEISAQKYLCHYDDCDHIDSEGCAIQWTESRHQHYITVYDECLEWEKLQLEHMKLKKSLGVNVKTTNNVTIPLLGDGQRSISRRQMRQRIHDEMDEIDIIR